MIDGGLKKIGLEAPADLVDAIQEARNAKRRYKNRPFSNKLAYEIGAKVLLEIDDDEEEEILDQRLDDIAREMVLLESRKKQLTEKKQKRTAEKQQKELEAIKEEQLIENIASKIREYWEKITLLDQKECIGYIVNLSPERLTRERVFSMFPKECRPIPTEHEARTMAANLLREDF
jgi:hypothetical protein